MAKYVNTVLIEAEQFDEVKWRSVYNDSHNPEEWDFEARKLGIDHYHGCFIIPTHEGDMRVHDGDWIATGINGEHWPIADDVFRKTYAELPVIPKVWADTIEEYKANHYRMDEIFTEWSWNYDEQELIARAWLDGYQVEEDE